MPRRIARVTSDARVRPPEEDDAVPGAAPGYAAPLDGDAVDGPSRKRRRERRATPDDGSGSGAGSRLSLPLVPLLATLSVLLLAAAAFLWFTRPEPSAVRTGDYVEALQAARSGIVDLTSFDHVTLDDDIEQIRRVATGDLREESVAELDDNRDQLIESKAIVNTEVVGAGVTRADGAAATVLMVIQATQESTASPQAQVSRYRIQVELTKEDDRWVLSGITGR
jgi:Mce-associated membrane protein